MSSFCLHTAIKEESKSLATPRGEHTRNLWARKFFVSLMEHCTILDERYNKIDVFAGEKKKKDIIMMKKMKI